MGDVLNSGIVGAPVVFGVIVGGEFFGTEGVEIFRLGVHDIAELTLLVHFLPRFDKRPIAAVFSAHINKIGMRGNDFLQLVSLL